MEHQVKWFRGLIVAEPLLFLLGVVLAFAFKPLSVDAGPIVSEETVSVTVSFITLSPFIYDWIVTIVALGWIASLIGLWRFKRWGRNVYTVAMGLMILIPYSLQPLTMQWYEQYLGSLVTLVSGALLAMMWFSDVRHKFEPRPLARPVQEPQS